MFDRANARTVRPATGGERTCKSWQTEAALRMLMNNLDPENAERPDDLVVYGGTGKAARDWAAFDAIVRALRALADDETLLVQSGKPVGVFRGHPAAPRVLLADVRCRTGRAASARGSGKQVSAGRALPSRRFKVGAPRRCRRVRPSPRWSPWRERSGPPGVCGRARCARRGASRRRWPP